MFGRAATKYFSLLNRQAAATVLRGARGSFRGGLPGLGRIGAARQSAEVFGRGARHYLWSGATSAERATRIGTVAGAGLLAGNFVNPRNNFGPF